MSNYPVGAEYDSNAPFNKKELQGETIGLFEYLENLEMPYEVRLKLKEFEEQISNINPKDFTCHKSYSLSKGQSLTYADVNFGRGWTT